MPDEKSNIYTVKLLKIKVFAMALGYLLLGYFKDTYRFTWAADFPWWVLRKNYLTGPHTSVDFMVSAILFTFFYGCLWLIFVSLFKYAQLSIKKWARLSFAAVWGTALLAGLLYRITGVQTMYYAAAGIKEFLFSPIFPAIWLPVLWYGSTPSARSLRS